MLVLVIDANEPPRSVLEQQIRQLGDLPMGAGGLEEALQLMRATAVDVVLMACEQPVTNSLEAWQALREVAGNQPRFVAMIPDPRTDDLAPLQAAGLKHFLPPDPDQDQLRLVLSDPDSSGIDEGTTGIPLMDPARLEDLLEIARINGADATRTIVTTFVESSESRFTQLQQALEAGDQTTLRRIRHGWAGIAGSLGAVRLVRTLKTLDPVEMLRSTEYSIEVLAQLRLEFDETREYFDVFCQGLT